MQFFAQTGQRWAKIHPKELILKIWKKIGKSVLGIFLGGGLGSGGSVPTNDEEIAQSIVGAIVGIILIFIRSPKDETN